jgi:hypothetical protein
MKALWRSWWDWTARVSDWGVWVLIMGLLVLAALILFAGAYRLGGGGELFGTDQEQKVTVQTVAPAVTFEPEVVDDDE